jgi:hypothetical protein
VLECPSHRAIQRYGTFFLRNARNCVDFVERDFLRDPGGREEIRSRFPHSGSSASARRPRFQPRARGLEQLATETNVVVSESARAVVSVALPIGRFSCPPESRWFAEPRPRHGEFCSVWIADLCEPRNQAQIVSLDARIWSDFVPGTPVDQDAVGGNLLWFHRADGQT